MKTAPSTPRGLRSPSQYQRQIGMISSSSARIFRGEDRRHRQLGFRSDSRLAVGHFFCAPGEYITGSGVLDHWSSGSRAAKPSEVADAPLSHHSVPKHDSGRGKPAVAPTTTTTAEPLRHGNGISTPNPLRLLTPAKKSGLFECPLRPHAAESSTLKTRSTGTASRWARADDYASSQRIGIRLHSDQLFDQPFP